MIRELAILLVLLTAPAQAQAETCIASWYGRESGPRTASGERFNENALTCAHRTRPLGSTVTVQDLHSGRTITCRVNDRGPAKWTGRCIDLSRAGARELGFEHAGTAKVSIQ